MTILDSTSVHQHLATKIWSTFGNKPTTKKRRHFFARAWTRRICFWQIWVMLFLTFYCRRLVGSSLWAENSTGQQLTSANILGVCSHNANIIATTTTITFVTIASIPRTFHESTLKLLRREPRLFLFRAHEDVEEPNTIGSNSSLVSLPCHPSCLRCCCSHSSCRWPTADCCRSPYLFFSPSFLFYFLSEKKRYNI